jgi:hypothetical protein
VERDPPWIAGRRSFVSVRGLSEDEQTARSDALSSLAERPRLRTPGGDEFDASGALQC